MKPKFNEGKAMVLGLILRAVDKGEDSSIFRNFMNSVL
jgi:hypothetical protein